MNPGNLALALALASGVTALCAYTLWVWGQAELRRAARIGSATMALAVVVASMFQMRNILTHQFQYEYVTNFSDRALRPVLLAASFWAGQAGSFILWALWSVLFALVLMRGLRRSAWEPFVLAPYLLVTICIIALTWAAGPFRLLAEYTHSAGTWVPADGRGLNPLLQNYC